MERRRIGEISYERDIQQFFYDPRIRLFGHPFFRGEIVDNHPFHIDTQSFRMIDSEKGVVLG